MKRYRPLQVEDIGERLRFHVRSETKPQSEFYLVDLGQNEQWGWCTCKHHATRLQPYLKEGITLPTKDRCKHVMAARDHIASVFISAVVMRYPEEIEQ